MTIFSTSVEMLHPSARSSFEHFANLQVITADDLQHSTTTERYAVISEHWNKCSDCAITLLLQSKHPLISNHAAMFKELYSASSKYAAA